MMEKRKSNFFITKLDSEIELKIYLGNELIEVAALYQLNAIQIDREKIYHVRCYKPPNTMTEFDRRLIRAVKKIEIPSGISEKRIPHKNSSRFDKSEPEAIDKDETVFFDK